MRSISTGSESTTALLRTYDSDKPFPCASAATSRHTRSSTAPIANGRRWTGTTPASSREMSRIAVNSASIALTDWSMRSTSSVPSAGIGTCRNAPTNRLNAWTGWRRSWLAAAKARLDVHGLRREILLPAEVLGQLRGALAFAFGGPLRADQLQLHLDLVAEFLDEPDVALRIRILLAVEQADRAERRVVGQRIGRPRYERPC